MIDIFPFVDKVLTPLNLTVELDYEDLAYSPPFIILTEIENKTDVIINGVEKYSNHIIQLDLYAETVPEVRNLMIDISEAMTKAGFRRMGASPPGIDESNLHRIIMMFSCMIDEEYSRIYAGV